ncbi:hypothetical protein JST97_17875 [bacterium]|nr:hypothetical protein [bacterium]
MSHEDPSYAPGSVVYEPFLGLCTVVSCNLETMLGCQQLFYEIRPRQGAAVVKVPAAQMATRGIRPLMSAQQIEETLNRAQTSQWEETEENYSLRLRRWNQLLRSEQKSGGYDFLSEWHHLVAHGVRLTTQETELHGKIQRSLLQEIAQVLQISPNKASLRLSRCWDNIKKPKEKKK